MTENPIPQSQIDAAVEILRKDAILQGNRGMLDRLDRLEGRVARLPVAEMTAEEKAAAYDKLMADNPGGGLPPAWPPAAPPAGAPTPPAPSPPAPEPKPGTQPPPTDPGQQGTNPPKDNGGRDTTRKYGSRWLGTYE